MNVNHFQLSMLAYNLNCWLALFHREETANVADLTHRTMATTRLRMLYLAARIWRHAGQTGIRCRSACPPPSPPPVQATYTPPSP